VGVPPPPLTGYLVQLMASRGEIGEALSNRSNSLNFLRLVLALTVLVSHAIGLGFGLDPSVNHTPTGTIAVYGFFGISGYLIAGSAIRNHAGRYLWQRFLRIFPGFWVALVLTAFFFGLIGWLSPGEYRLVGFIAHGDSHCGVSCYLGARNSPFDYVLSNGLLKINQPLIAGTAWNGSLWTLFFEFLSYLFLLALAMAGFLRQRIWTLATTIGLWAIVTAITFIPSYAERFSSPAYGFAMDFLKLTTIFMVGAVIFLYRDRIPDSGWLALLCAVVFTASLWLPGEFPMWGFTPSDLLAPLIAYPLLWLGIHLPFQKIGSKNDYSYGLYIYAYPVTVLLAIWHIQRWGEAVFVLLCIAATVPFAVGSWWFIEKRALNQKRMDPKVILSRILGPKRVQSAEPPEPPEIIALERSLSSESDGS
jgi:peptidoglycan/LPS O-acetylase OafA/YrhL